MSGGIIKYDATDGTKVELTPEQVIEEIVPAKDKAAMTRRNVAVIMAKLAACRMNPLAGDCAVGVFKGRPTVMPSIGYYRRTAASQPTFDGCEKGVIAVAADGKVRHLTGSFLPDGWQLAGGWCKAYRKDRSRPSDVTVSLSEYDQHNTMWESKPATMIQKVAESQALRELYPGVFEGTYTKDELPDEDAELQEVEYAVEPMPEVPAFGGATEGEAVPDEAYEDAVPGFGADNDNTENKED